MHLKTFATSVKSILCLVCVQINKKKKKNCNQVPLMDATTIPNIQYGCDVLTSKSIHIWTRNKS